MIKLESVSFRYEGVTENALTNISLRVESGHCVIISGASGCGKTTVTRLVNGLIPGFYPGELSGGVKIGGENILGKQPHELCEKIGSVFQNPKTQFFNTDTDSELVFGMENCGIPYEEMHHRYEQTVADLGIQKLCRRDIFALSGGEKQSIAFGSIYALSPDIFVLDEPSANLDREAVDRLGQLLLALKQQGKTILISEHRLYYLREIADTVILLENGSITACYSMNELAEMGTEALHEIGLRSLWDTPIESVPVSCPTRVPALEVRELTVKRKKQTILDKVNLTADVGEIIGMTGPNGIGKTTLARAICGLMQEKSGSIYYDGLLMDIRSRKQCTFLVMQDSNYQLFGDSVENEMTLTASGELSKKDKMDQILKSLNLTELRARHPLSLSGGQKQRLCIALASLSDAKVLLFDEPTSGLDYGNMKHVAKMLKALAAAGKAVVVISHDNEFLALSCTRIIYLSR